MSNIYENILSGLQEAIDDSVAEKKTLKRRVLHMQLSVANVPRRLGGLLGACKVYLKQEKTSRRTTYESGRENL